MLQNILIFDKELGIGLDIDYAVENGKIIILAVEDIDEVDMYG